MKSFNGICLCCLMSLALVSAVPEYQIDEHCSQTLALNYGSVEAVKLSLTKSEKYPDGMRCAMRIQAPEGKKLLIRIKTLDIRGTQGSLCQDGDYLQLFDGPTESAITHPDVPQAICEKPDVSTISTSGRFLVLRFLSNTDLNAGTGLKLLITAFTDDPCEHSQYRCRTTGQCIQGSLQCNGENNCPDDSDESMPECLSTAAIAGIAIAGVTVIVAIVVAAIVACVIYERRKRARIIKRAMDTGSFPETIWDVSKTPPIDASFIDPIWDGGTTSSDHVTKSNKNVHELSERKVYRSNSKIHEHVQQNVGQIVRKPSNTITVDSDEFTKGIKVLGPKGQEIIKVPSGFWEINLGDLGVDLYKDNPMTVL